MLHIPALWYFDTPVTYPQWFRRVKFVLIPPRLIQQQYLWNIAIQPAAGCYNSWANIRCSGCSPLWEISFWNGTIQRMAWHPRDVKLLNKSYDNLVHWCICASPSFNVIGREISSACDKIGDGDSGHVWVRDFTSEKNALLLGGIIQTVWQYTTLYNPGMLCWREPIKALAAAMGLPWGRYKLLKIYRVLNMLLSMPAWGL